MLRQIGLCLVAVGILVTPLAAQGKGRKKYAVTNDRALVVTKDALVKQGYEVVSVENNGHDVVVWYRRGRRGRGKGEGPPAKMVMHRTEARGVFRSALRGGLGDIG